MHWTILSGAIGAALYAGISIIRGRRRPDLRVLLGCLTYAAALPASVVFLFRAITGDRQALEELAKHHEFPWFAGTAALVVLYHASEHLYDTIKGAWSSNVPAKAEPSESGDPSRTGKPSAG
jgi:hypothetical protein